MRQSNLFTKINKNLPKDEDSYNAQILIKAGFIDKLSAGIYTWLPLGLRVINKISNIVREELNKQGAQEILMPALSPKDNWQKTDRWDNFDALFKLSASDTKEYALGATHEEIVSPLMQKFIFSYKDLPSAVYQIQTKFRNEKRAKAGLIRGREFLMKDLYSFHENQESLDDYYEKIKQTYFNIYSILGLKDKTFLTYASGGDFSKYSHEFQTITKAGEDKIYICKDCKVAINEEIIDTQKLCPECKSDNFKEEKAVEVGNIFKLGDRFSKAFNFKYSDSEGQLQPIIMGCYGLGLSRVLATVVECLNDDKGVIWPSSIAPFKVHLLSLSKDKEALKIYNDLVSNDIEVLFDDRDISYGEKFAEADLISCPFRIIVSEKTLAENSVEIKARDKQDATLVSVEDIIKNIK